ncbi:kinase that interacts with cdc31p [Dispira parvispora]|uniref:non-specific serine/threonine protein kinase n=1 Tax=Dispira parvispora TaxID=1520584 RepID=A0A9W8E2D6_9FUNG|nr:kinase that interacts with cdc31p [Dispira parvispora]
MAERYRKGEFIGKGAYGSVYKGFDLVEKRVVAIKILNLDTKEDEIRDIQREITTLSQLHHEHITQYYGCVLHGTQLWIIMDYAGGGSVRTLMECGPLEEKYISAIVRDLLSALSYLHHCNIIHRDIKAANVLLTDQGQVKLCDFGVARPIVGHRARRYSFAGTPYWMAPEIIDQNSNYGSKVDIWSLGITVYEMLTGNPPHIEVDPKNLLTSQRNNTSKIKFKKDHPPAIRDFIQRCLIRNPDERPSADDLLKHRFIKRPHHSKRPNLVYLVQRYEKWRNGLGVSHESDHSANSSPRSTSPTNLTKSNDADWDFCRTSSVDRLGPTYGATPLLSPPTGTDSTPTKSSYLDSDALGNDTTGVQPPSFARELFSHSAPDSQSSEFQKLKEHGAVSPGWTGGPPIPGNAPTALSLTPELGASSHSPTSEERAMFLGEGQHPAVGRQVPLSALALPTSGPSSVSAQPARSLSAHNSPSAYQPSVWTKPIFSEGSLEPVYAEQAPIPSGDEVHISTPAAFGTFVLNQSAKRTCQSTPASPMEGRPEAIPQWMTDPRLLALPPAIGVRKDASHVTAPTSGELRTSVDSAPTTSLLPLSTGSGSKSPRSLHRSFIRDPLRRVKSFHPTKKSLWSLRLPSPFHSSNQPASQKHRFPTFGSRRSDPKSAQPIVSRPLPFDRNSAVALSPSRVDPAFMMATSHQHPPSAPVSNDSAPNLTLYNPLAKEPPDRTSANIVTRQRLRRAHSLELTGYQPQEKPHVRTSYILPPSPSTLRFTSPYGTEDQSNPKSLKVQYSPTYPSVQSNAPVNTTADLLGDNRAVQARLGYGGVPYSDKVLPVSAKVVQRVPAILPSPIPPGYSSGKLPAPAAIPTHPPQPTYRQHQSPAAQLLSNSSESPGSTQPVADGMMQSNSFTNSTSVIPLLPSALATSDLTDIDRLSDRDWLRSHISETLLELKQSISVIQDELSKIQL